MKLDDKTKFMNEGRQRARKAVKTLEQLAEYRKSYSRRVQNNYKEKQRLDGELLALLHLEQELKGKALPVGSRVVVSRHAYANRGKDMCGLLGTIKRHRRTRASVEVDGMGGWLLNYSDFNEATEKAISEAQMNVKFGEVFSKVFD